MNDPAFINQPVLYNNALSMCAYTVCHSNDILRALAFNQYCKTMLGYMMKVGDHFTHYAVIQHSLIPNAGNTVMMIWHGIIKMCYA